MNKSIVSLAAVLFCCAVIGAVVLFGYSRYKANKASESVLRAELMKQDEDALRARMPGQLPARGTQINGTVPQASPAPQQQ